MLVDDREPSARPAEARVHDVVEDRSEAVAEPEIHEVRVRRRQLAQSQQTIGVAQIPARQVELVAHQGYLTEEKERESLEQSKVETVEEDQVSLADVVRVNRTLERAADRSPRLLEIE